MRVHIVMLHLNQIFRIIYKYTIIKYIYIYTVIFKSLFIHIDEKYFYILEK
jgi:hypothetical protein